MAADGGSGERQRGEHPKQLARRGVNRSISLP